MGHSVLRTLMVLGLAGSMFALSAAPACAAQIKDDAGFFSQKALDKAGAQLAELKKAHDKEVRIDTFKTVPGGKGDDIAKMDRTERAKFFEKWARERATAEHARGIYVLICKSPGYVQVEEDKQTRSQGFGVAERGELRDKLLAGFREKEYDKALLDAVDYLSREVKKLKPATAEKGPVAAPHRDARHAEQHENRDLGQPAPHRAGMGWLGWVVLFVVILLAVRLIGALFSGGGGGYGPGGYGYGGGGGIWGSLMTGMFGAFAGNWLYHQFFDTPTYGGTTGAFGGDDHRGDAGDSAGAGEDWEGSGGEFDSGDSGGGDFGGGDFGGGDFGGGDFGGGGDF